ncbi:hypothetical protein IFS44_15325 [Sphingomonas sp. CFBP 13706]|nr:hypothetical protein [Sphingomonas sp. CFBP 13706]
MSVEVILKAARIEQAADRPIDRFKAIGGEIEMSELRSKACQPFVSWNTWSRSPTHGISGGLPRLHMFPNQR